MKYSSAFPYFSDKSIRSIMTDIESTLRTGILTNGPRIQELEFEFSKYTNNKFAVAVDSGASSLEIALRYFGVRGREVIVPTNTFVATPNSVVFAEGRPIFADIKEETLCLDPEDVKLRISSKTAGIIVVHIAGLVCPQINELKRLCREYGLFLIEDCAHAHGATFDGKKAGSLGDVGCFSFAPTKVMTTGEGGILTTNNDELFKTARILRNRGLNSDNLMTLLGHSWTMSEIVAILGINQLRNLEYFVEERNKIALAYRHLLRDANNLEILPVPPNIRHSYHKFPVLLDEKYDVNKVAIELKEKYNVETGRVYYPPCHMHPYYRENFKTCEGDFPVSERVLKRILCLPIHLKLSNAGIQYIVDSLMASLNNFQNEFD